MTLSWNEIQDRATEFASKWDGETYEKGESQSFWSDFLTVFGIDRRRHGAFFEYAIKKGSGKQGFIDMFWPGKLLAEQKSGGRDLGAATIQAYEYLETMPDHDLPQGIVVSDFASFEFIELESQEKTTFKLQDFPRNVKLFAFLIGETSKKIVEEQPVNRSAAEAMALLHNQLRDDKYTGHDLEVLLVRLVFCLFADDSGIFEKSQMHEYVLNRTNEDGSDLGSHLIELFEILNTSKDQRQRSLDENLLSFEYVNGGLFADSIRTPHFTAAMRRDLLKAMELDWAKVSPAIFGSMFQGVMDEKQRRNLGAHYTSEKNILRVIKPLFLDDLYVEFAKAATSGPRKKFEELQKFHDKLASLTFLDPACGCGNFLVITYRELRRLEHKVLTILDKGEQSIDWLASSAEHGRIKVDVSQMYGIEIEEFPSLIAQTAMWLTDHQMNMEFSQLSGKTFKRLPLKTSATIVNDNALTKDWAEVIEPQKLNYILGNPPFLGSALQDNTQKGAFASVCSALPGFGVLDFVAAWYVKATAYMSQNPKIQTALVSTNSITQGEQPPVLWKYLLQQDVHINFAHQTFKWSNDAKGNAAVYCVIIGFALFDRPKRIFEYTDIKGEPIEIAAKNINPYLVDAPTVIIDSRTKPIANVPQMRRGNSPYDDGNFLISTVEKEQLLKQEPQLAKYIKHFIGAKEFLNNTDKYCFWLLDADPSDVRNSKILRERINNVRNFRLASKRQSTVTAADKPTLFSEIKDAGNGFIAVPRVSSENRDYIPMGFYDGSYIAGDTTMIIPGGTLYHFGILTSQMHMAWMRAVAGRLKSDYRYSKDIVYNNFIWPEVSEEQEAEIKKLAQTVLDTRAEFPDASLADLYDPLTMPPSLSKAHKTLDRAVDKLYSNKPFTSDSECVAMLFEKYQKAMDVK